MNATSAVLAIGFVLLAGIGGEESKTDLQRLEGSWQVVTIEAPGGKKVDPGKGMAPDRIVVKDGKASFFAGEKETPTMQDLRLQVDPQHKPKALDLVRNEKESLPCLYEVTVDELKLAMPLVRENKKPGESLSRPKSFDPNDGAFIVLRAKRVKG